MKYSQLIAIFFLPFTLFAFEPHPVTPFPVVGYREIPFFDENDQINRNLLIWYPVNPETRGLPSSNAWDTFNIAVDAPPAIAKKKRAAIVISHGYTGNPHQLSWLIRGLVNAGFIVTGIQHRDLIDGKVHVNHWRRPRDIRMLINQLGPNASDLSLDMKRIGIAGFSLGGTTAVWVAGGKSTLLDTLIPGPEYASEEDFSRADDALPSLDKTMMAKDWKDPRIKAAFIMAPAWAWIFDQENLKKVSIPTYFIAAAADPVLVTKNNAGFFSRNISDSIYKTVPGQAGHYIFISALDEKQQKQADPSRQLTFLFEDDISIDRRWIQQQLIEEAVRFFSESM